MEWIQRIGILAILAPGLIMALAGCAGAPVNKTFQAEEALAAAGFQLKMADTPAKLERISHIAQKKVVRAMIKDRENPDAVGGWVWLAVDGTTRNETVVTGRFCVSCHRAANDAHAYGDKNPDREFRDFIFLPPFAKLQNQ